MTWPDAVVIVGLLVAAAALTGIALVLRAKS
jgi:hypothetical protein